MVDVVRPRDDYGVFVREVMNDVRERKTCFVFWLTNHKFFQSFAPSAYKSIMLSTGLFGKRVRKLYPFKMLMSVSSQLTH